MSSSMLSPTQRYAAGALFGLALHQAQVIQTCQLGFPDNDDDAGPIQDRVSSGSSSDSVSEDHQLWVNPSSGLLRPVLRYLEIDSKAWSGLEETSACSPVTHHVGAFLRVLSEEKRDDTSSEAADKELALTKSIDALASSMESTTDDHCKSQKEKQQEYESSCREKYSTSETTDKQKLEAGGNQPEMNDKAFVVERIHVESRGEFNNENIQKPVEELTMLGDSKKVVVLYELLSACLANKSEDKEKIKRRKGYDARHRVALRLLATWFDVKWIKMEAIETMVACSAMAVLKENEAKEEAASPQSSWAKWKRGGIIGAAALTGGTLMAITGGMICIILSQ